MSKINPLHSIKMSTPWLCFLALQILVGFSFGEQTRRCDLLLKNTPAPNTGANSVCLDLKSNGGAGPLIQTVENATRIAHDGIVLCKNAFEISNAGEADIVFIMDNTGSMQYGDPHFCSYPGDPTFARDDVVKRGMALERSLAVKVTAGFISFNSTIVQQTRIQPLLNISRSDLNGANNLALLQAKVIADPGINPPADSCKRDEPTSGDWGPSFDLARSWLGNPTLAKSLNHAIILISDGAVSDYARVKALALADSLPPVYGIHLGRLTDKVGLPDQAAANLQELTSLTKGQFFRILPTDTLAMRVAMDTIVSRLVTRPVQASKLQIWNAASPTRISMAETNDIVVLDTGVSFNNMQVTLDSSLVINKDTMNTFNVRISLGDSIRAFTFRVQENTSFANEDSTGFLTCYDSASITMSAASSGYHVTLNRSRSELGAVDVLGTSSDNLRKTWGDLESIPLPVTSSSADYKVVSNLTLSPYPFDGSAILSIPSTAYHNNGKLETDDNGTVTLRWEHPRDPRDTAVYELPQTHVTLHRLVDLTKGTPVSGDINNPVVIYRGVTFDLVNKKDSAKIVTPGKCVSNCNSASSSYISLGAGTSDRTPNAPSFIVRTKSPFSYTLHVYDNLGHFVNKAEDSTTGWGTVSDDGSVVLSLVPVSKNGQMLGTGVYFVRLAITTKTSAGLTVTDKFLTRFGFLHP